jgi:hypothetical protein
MYNNLIILCEGRETRKRKRGLKGEPVFFKNSERKMTEKLKCGKL